jgi:hypothetical protein
MAGIRVADQLWRGGTDREAVWRDLNAAFLMVLAGLLEEEDPEYVRFTSELRKNPIFKDGVAFYKTGIALIPAETEARCKAVPEFHENLERLVQWVGKSADGSMDLETIERMWSVFFPEGVSLFRETERAVQSLRRRRSVGITRLNPDPVRDPAREILFTSNALLTVPPAGPRPKSPWLSEALWKRATGIARESQRYWYDHPVPIGVDPRHNELVHGLVGLDRAVSFEKACGKAKREDRVTCLLSISCTHEGLQSISRKYIEETLRAATRIRHLDIYAMSEADVRRLGREVLIPAGIHYLGAERQEILEEVLGVDGEYGRHYSFLKAVAAFWHVFIDPAVKATFKVDLDQTFPQPELVKETHSSAFDHFRTPLWGAEGVDWQGHSVCLGMIAGALVNESDIHHSLFTPDVPVPDSQIHGDEWIFFSPLPQAVSTQAEMMTRYGGGALDGRHACIQRVHVTGGTSGILVDSLRKYRPFTPGFIGRAEDQAYLLSVLFHGSEGYLRYVHKDGLFMRHDKESVAGEAIETAAAGKRIGDYSRILLFSQYADALPWSVDQIKALMDPFTGCFISNIPLTVVYLRLALKAASLFEQGKESSARELLEMGARRLGKIVRVWEDQPNRLRTIYMREKKGWDMFYDILDSVEEGLASGDPFAVELRNRAQRVVGACRVQVEAEPSV